MKKLLCACAVLVAGCSSNPETETPVQLLPGSYEVMAGGGTMVTLRGGERRGLICIGADSATMFKSDPLAQVTADWEDCSDEYADPKGNALSGTRRCDRKTPVLVTYTGSHTADSFEFKGTVSQGSDETGAVMRLGSGDFTVTGKRKGDC
jgi:hypothetical protein